VRRIQYLATKTVGSEGLRRRGTTGGEDPVLGNQDYGRQPPRSHGGVALRAATMGYPATKTIYRCFAVCLGNYTAMGGPTILHGTYLIIWDPIAVEAETNVI